MGNTTQKFIGIDFSGAEAAGSDIRIAQGRVVSGALRIDSCQRALDLLNCPDYRDTVHTELARWIDSLTDVTVGLDFPFSVPKVVAQTVFQVNSWDKLVTAPRWGNLNPRTFVGQCRNLPGNVLRETDASNRGQCPYGITVYKQTFYGIREILQPLYQNNVSIAPMVDTQRNATVLETYPAATLARDDDLFAIRYKGDGLYRDRRKHNVQTLAQFPDLDISNLSQNRIIDDKDGDAMDSIVAALATFRAAHNSSPFAVTPLNPLEGHIYA